MSCDSRLLAALSLFATTLTLSAGTVLENENVRLSFDDRGWVTSMKEKPSGRELVRNATSFVTVRDQAKAEKNAVKLEKRGEGRYAWIFPDALGEAVFSVTPFDGGWTFKNETCTVKGATALTFCRVDPVCVKYNGAVANALSDDESAVMVRPYDFRTDAGRLWVSVVPSERCPLAGHAAGLFAGPRAKLIPAWKAMTIAAKAPHSTAGGAWALESSDTDRSYLFCWPKTGPRWDEWREQCRRAGCGVFHIICWEDGSDFFKPSPRLFPEGMKKVVDSFHEAGVKVSIHTYTTAVGTKMPYTSAEWCGDFTTAASYTLAKSFAPGDTEIVVNERPVDSHMCEFGYCGGNVMRLGTELVSYTGVRREKPYGFTGVKRGAFKNVATAKTYPAGTKTDYLRIMYGSFYAEPDSKLADHLMARAKATFDGAGLDQIYFDASEGAGIDAAADGLRRRLADAVTSGGRPVVIEASDYTVQSGWFHSRVGALDSPRWGVKRFHDQHLKDVLAPLSDFIPGHLGWWAVSVQGGDEEWGWSRGKTAEENEYFGCKTAAWDVSMSVQGMEVPWKGPANFTLSRMATIIGDWERPRYAKAFKAGLQERLKKGRDEWRIRQGEDGVWRVAPQTVTYHRVNTPLAREWTVESKTPAKAEFRVDALYGIADYADTNAVVVCGPDQFAKAKPLGTNGVKTAVQVGSDAAHGATLKITAENANEWAYGAWAKVETVWKKLADGRTSDRKRKLYRGFGLWVKGDGSGATLDVSPICYHSYGVHFLKLDFTGWRYFTFLTREKDIYEMEKHLWPNRDRRVKHHTFNDPFSPDAFTGITLWLHDVPAKGKTAIEISEVRSLPELVENLDAASVTVNGTDVKIPFGLRSGDWAEFAEGVWTAFDRYGTPKRRVATGAKPLLKEGANALSFAAKNAAGRAVRAEVATLGVGAFETALKEGAKLWKYEPLPPAVVRPKDGFAELPVLAVRPGEKAKLEVSVWGPVTNAKLIAKGTHGEKTYPLADKLEKDVVRRVTLDGPFSGTSTLKLVCDEGAAADVRIDMAKIY